MFIFEVLLPSLLAGGLMIFFSEQIAHFFERTGSTNLIRGLDNPWSFKALGFVIAVGFPLYKIVELAVFTSVMG